VDKIQGLVEECGSSYLRDYEIARRRIEASACHGMTEQLLHWLTQQSDSSVAGWTMVVVAFAVTQVMFIPRAALSIAAGALYGVAIIPLVAAGTTLGAVIAFLLARHVFSRQAQRMVASRPKLQRILSAVDAEGWRLVALSRFGMPVPASVVNYGFGLTNIGVWPFTWATFAFCIPQAALFVYLGAAGRSLLAAETLSTGHLLLLLTGAVTAALAVYLVSARLKEVAQR
jgi:uncharacterized membrane protein YdjX (TVP38/TMEM64 family)